MTGWKTYVGAILILCAGIVEALKYMAIIPEPVADGISASLGSLGAAFGVVGLGHKIEKASK